MNVLVSQSCFRLFETPWTVTNHSPLSMEFSGKITEMGCHSLLQRIFLAQGSNLCLLHCRQTIYCLKVKVLVAQSCLTLCDSMDCSPPGSSVHGIIQARILERLPFPSSRDLLKPGTWSPGSNLGLLYCRHSLLSKPLVNK